MIYGGFIFNRLESLTNVYNDLFFHFNLTNSNLNYTDMALVKKVLV